MNRYCMSRVEPHKYYSSTVYVEDDEFPSAIWKLREMGKEELIFISSNEYNENYVSCSPFEAISSITK